MGPTFRDEIANDYKAGRAETPDDLSPQFDMIRAVLASLSVPLLEAEGFEADDVLATLATEARDRQCPAIVVTGDRDCFQLVEDPYIQVLYNRRGVSDYALYDEAGIVARTGVRPDQYPILASLRGDPSDNLSGVPGIGEKTAAKLVNQYGSLDTLFADLGSLSAKMRDNLATYEENVRRNAEIIPLIRDVPLDVAVDDLHLGGWDAERAKQVFSEFELRTLWTRLSVLMDEGAFGPPAGRLRRGRHPPGGGDDVRCRSVDGSRSRGRSGRGHAKLVGRADVGAAGHGRRRSGVGDRFGRGGPGDDRQPGAGSRLVGRSGSVTADLRVSGHRGHRRRGWEGRSSRPAGHGRPDFGTR